MTNYERIKAMSVSELADLLKDEVCEFCLFYHENFDCDYCDDGIAKAGIMQWLISEEERNSNQ